MPRMKMDLLIRNVRVWDDQPIMDVGSKDGKIVAIEKGIEASAVENIDAGGRAVIPGLIEPHLHLDKAMLHRRLPASRGTLDEAIRVTGILKSKQERADVLDRSRRVLDMAVQNGTGSNRAHPHVYLIPGLIAGEKMHSLRYEKPNP